MKNSLMIDNYTEEELEKMDSSLVRNLLQYSIIIKKIIREKLGGEFQEKMILDLSKYEK
jgi:hypothetical protein